MLNKRIFKNSKSSRFWIIFAVFLMNCLQVSAQQTVFNVPSADVTEKGHFFVQQEVQFRGWGEDAFFNGTSFTSYGIGHNTDINVDLFNVSAPASHNITMGVGFKTSMPIAGLKEKFPEREIKLTVGSNVLISLEGQGVGNWTYTHLSGRVPKLNTRLTGGISYGTRQVFGTDNVCFIAAIEQPITKKVDLLADWFSGNEHFAGFLIVGGSYKLPKNTTIYAGYQIPNTPENGVSGFVIQLAKIF